ncbi:MAG TPA: LysE family transporter [Chondromyces sp.]|nr:LysE family transporter [Chondromyces sp.]
MNTLLGYIFLGISLAAPIGPINAAQLDKGIKNGFMSAWMVGVGALMADLFYMMLVYIGVGQFITTPFVKTFLWSFGFFVLVYTGVECLISAGKVAAASERESETAAKSFFSGFILSLTSPLTILFWLGIYGSVLADTVETYGTDRLLLYSSAIVIGVLVWDVTMAAVASSFRKILTSRLLIIISILSGLSLIGFGIYFGMQAFQALFL